MENPRKSKFDRLVAATRRAEQIRAALDTTSASPAASLVPAVEFLIEDLRRIELQVRDANGELDQLRQQTATTVTFAQLLFDRSPVPCLVIDRRGFIQRANAAAGRLLNLSARSLPGRSFQMFLTSERESFVARLPLSADDQQAMPRALTVRPRERSSKQVTLTAVPDESDNVVLFMQPMDDTGGAGSGADGLASVDADEETGSAEHAALSAEHEALLRETRTLLAQHHALKQASPSMPDLRTHQEQLRAHIGKLTEHMRQVVSDTRLQDENEEL